MRNFHIPFDMHTEDKIIGGYLSLRQLAWILIGGIGTIFLFVPVEGYLVREIVDGVEVQSLNAFSLSIRILIAIVLIAGAVFLTFFKVEEMEADKYLIKKILFMRKTRIIKYTDRR